VENVAEGGPALAFVAFPYALAQLPYSAYFSFIFFFALVTLGIDSAFSLTESMLAAVVDKTGWRRSIVLPLITVVGIAVGVVYVTQGGLNWLGVIGDVVDGTWGIAFLGLLECIVLGWLWRIDSLRRHANERSDWRLGKWWNYLIRVFIPIVLSSLFVWSLFDDLTQEGGFLRDETGGWILADCVGLSVIVLVPLAGVLIGFSKGRSEVYGGGGSERVLEIKGRAGGVTVFVFAVISVCLAAYLFGCAVAGRDEKSVLWLLPIPAVVAAIGGNYLVDRYTTSTTVPSWFARWAGLLGTLCVGAFISLNLIYSTRGKEAPELVSRTAGQLSGVSYVILSVALLLIIGGLGWCFFRALTATGRDNEPQSADEGGADV
jgi:NSS family neurotransmitter:Na+ symporter